VHREIQKTGYLPQTQPEAIPTNGNGNGHHTSMVPMGINTTGVLLGHHRTEVLGLAGHWNWILKPEKGVERS
jgi:hypothetical protein